LWLWSEQIMAFVAENPKRQMRYSFCVPVRRASPMRGLATEASACRVYPNQYLVARRAIERAARAFIDDLRARHRGRTSTVPRSAPLDEAMKERVTTRPGNWSRAVTAPASWIEDGTGGQ